MHYFCISSAKNEFFNTVDEVVSQKSELFRCCADDGSMLRNRKLK